MLVFSVPWVGDTKADRGLVAFLGSSNIRDRFGDQCYVGLQNKLGKAHRF